MKTEKIPIGLIIRQIAEEKKIKTKVLADKKGVTAQAVHAMFKQKNVRSGDLQQWASILGVSAEEIINRTNSEEIKAKTENADLFSKGDGYLMLYIAELEERVKEQAATIRVLLGKSDGVSITARFAPPFLGAIGRKSGYTGSSILLEVA